jgi:hypothetical protein
VRLAAGSEKTMPREIHPNVDWPDGFEPTPPAKRESYPHGFRVTQTQAFKNIHDELDKMDVDTRRVETATQQVNDRPQRPYKDADPDDPVVVVYFEQDGAQFAIPCDCWDNLRDNAQAIARYLDAKRALDRYGVKTITSEFETQALPPGDESDGQDDVVAAGPGGNGAGTPPHEILEVVPDASDEVVESVARRKMANVHPDQPDGDREEYHRIQNAKEAMLDE